MVEKVISKLEDVIEKWLGDLEQKPLITIVKIWVMVWLIKEIYKQFKDGK